MKGLAGPAAGWDYHYSSRTRGALVCAPSITKQSKPGPLGALTQPSCITWDNPSIPFRRTVQTTAAFLLLNTNHNWRILLVRTNAPLFPPLRPATATATATDTPDIHHVVSRSRTAGGRGEQEDPLPLLHRMVSRPTPQHQALC